MKNHLLFIQGAGKNAHAEDAEVVASLKKLLPSSYEIHFPVMKNEEDASYDTWALQIEEEIKALGDGVIVVGHSVGASILIKFLCEQPVSTNLRGIFLIAAPFWGGEKGWTYDGYEKLMLASDAAAKLPKHAPLFLYQSEDDEIVPFAHLKLFSDLFPEATVRRFKSGGHQLKNDLSGVADDIRNLEKGF